MLYLLLRALVVWLASSAAVVAPLRPRVSAAMVAPYGLAVGAASWRILRDLDQDARADVVPAALVAMQVGWGVGFLTGARRLLARHPASHVVRN